MKNAIAIILVSIITLTLIVACNGADTTRDTQDVSEIYGSDPQNTTLPDSPKVPTADTPDNPAPATQDNPAPPPADSFDTSRVIAVFTREDGSGTRDAFVSLTGVGDDMYVEAVVENETNQILTKVEENLYAISYASVGSLNPKVKALEIDGVAPSDATITDGSYILQRPLLVCVNADNENNPIVPKSGFSFKSNPYDSLPCCANSFSIFSLMNRRNRKAFS